MAATSRRGALSALGSELARSGRGKAGHPHGPSQGLERLGRLAGPGSPLWGRVIGASTGRHAIPGHFQAFVSPASAAHYLHAPGHWALFRPRPQGRNGQGTTAPSSQPAPCPRGHARARPSWGLWAAQSLWIPTACGTQSPMMALVGVPMWDRAESEEAAWSAALTLSNLAALPPRQSLRPSTHP